MPRVIHFEISVDDPDRAAKFYSNIFGWRIEKSRGPVDYWLISTGEKNEPGIDGAIKSKERRVPPTLSMFPSSMNSSKRSRRMEAKYSCPK